MSCLILYDGVRKALIFHFVIFKRYTTQHTLILMNNIKKIALTFFLSISFATVTPIAVAAEVAVSSKNEVASVIIHIEKGLAEVQKSDFSAAYLHLKSAREASGKIQGNENLVKQGLASVIQGQIQTNHGDVANATAELNKALSLYRSIK